MIWFWIWLAGAAASLYVLSRPIHGINYREALTDRAWLLLLSALWPITWFALLIAFATAMPWPKWRRR